MPNVKNKWPIQREPSVVAGHTFLNQQPTIGVFGQTGYDRIPTADLRVLAQQKVVTEQTAIQEQPELHKVPIVEDPEILAAEMLLKADREATDWDITTFIFDGINPQQLGRMVGRVSLLFFNATATVIIARTVANLSASSNKNWALNVGSTSTLKTEGEFWLTAASGTKLSVIETFWDLEAMAIAKLRTQRRHPQTPNWSGVKASANTK
jgi:hypothetical protein